MGDAPREPVHARADHNEPRPFRHSVTPIDKALATTPMPNDLTAQGGNRGSASLVDILDRVLDKGLVIAGDIKVSLADIELLTIRIRLMICSIDKAEQIGLDWWKYDPNLSIGRHEAMLQENAELREQLRSLEQRVQSLAAPPARKASPKRGRAKR